VKLKSLRAIGRAVTRRYARRSSWLLRRSTHLAALTAATALMTLSAFALMSLGEARAPDHVTPTTAPSPEQPSSGADSAENGSREGSKTESVGPPINDEGITWTVVTHLAAGPPRSQCVRINASRTSTAEPLGDLGACGFPNVTFDGREFKSTTGRPEVIPVIGTLLVRDSQTMQRNFTVVFGVTTCTCRIKAKLTDASTLVGNSSKGVFLIQTSTVVEVTGVEALDASGFVIANTDIPQAERSRLKSPPNR
jgi:hypothetical protein